IRDPLVTGVQTCALPIFAILASLPHEIGAPDKLKVITHGPTLPKLCYVHKVECEVNILSRNLYSDLLYWHPGPCGKVSTFHLVRSEERRVGKDCRARMVP